MSLKQATLVALSVVWLSSCGAGPIDPPPDPSWAVGTFSELPFEGKATYAVTRWVILEDGRARLDSVYNCGGPGSVEEGEELEWESDEAIIIRGLFGYEEVRVTRIDCNTIEFHEVGGTQSKLGTWYRGEMCLEEIPGSCPDGVECDSCRTAWCDGPPPPCE